MSGTVSSVEQLDALPVGTVIMWIDPAEPESPAVACRAARGWQFLGDLTDRRYESSALAPVKQHPIHVLHNPCTHVNTHLRGFTQVCEECGQGRDIG